MIADDCSCIKKVNCGCEGGAPCPLWICDYQNCENTKDV